MQTFAYDLRGNIISAGSGARKTSYLCIECGQSMRWRQGIRRKPHFYHLKQSSCRKTKSLFHQKIQRTLAHRLRPERILLEEPFPLIHRVADLFWPRKRYIFEIQCSPISLSEIQERTEDYESLGYEVFWILYDETFKKEHLSEAELFLQKRRYFFISKNLFLYEQRFQLSSFKRIAFSQKRPITLQPFDPLYEPGWTFTPLPRRKRSPHINFLLFLMRRFCN